MDTALTASRWWDGRSLAVVILAPWLLTGPGRGTAAGQDMRQPTTTTISLLESEPAACCPMPFSVGVQPTVEGAPALFTFLLDGKPFSAVFRGEGLFFASLPPGPHQFVARFPGTATLAPSDSAPVTLTVSETSPHLQWFAEGATGFFETSIGVLNAGTADAEVQVHLLPEHGTASFDRPALAFTLPPMRRRTIDLNALAGPVGGVGALVTANCCPLLVATRRMTWGAPAYGSTVESGGVALANAWYFAEGATNAFSLFYLLLNPGTSPASVTLTHLLEGGAPPVIQHAIVPPGTRRTLFVNDVPGLERAAFSTVVTSDQSIVAERAMYLNTTGRLWEGGTAGRGATALSDTWSFAEGAAGFFHTYLLLGNPGATDVTASVRFLLSDGTVITRTYTVAAASRRTIDVPFEDTRLAASSFGMSVTTTAPIMAERAMWWGLPFRDGSVSLGAMTPRMRWGIGEGIDGGANGASTFVLVANSTSLAASVRFTVVYDDGTNDTRDFALLASARLTVRIAEVFPRAANARFSVLVDSLSETVPITVESAEYQSASDLLDGGGGAQATPIR